MKTWVKAFVTFFWRLIAILIITVAVIVVVGRELAPHIDRYRPQIESYLSEKLDATVSLSSIAMTWERLSVSLEISNFIMSKSEPSDEPDMLADAHLPSLSVAKANIELDLLASITQWRLAFKTLMLEDAKITVAQNDEGLWNLEGYEKALLTNRKLSLNTTSDPADWFLLSRQVALSNAQVSVLFRDGAQAQINANSITIENDSGFHRLKAAIDVEGESDSLELIVEGKGDPRDRQQFKAQGFLKVDDFSAERFLELIPARKLNDMNLQWQEASNLDLRLWLSFPEPNVFDVTGSVAFTPGELAVGQQKISLSAPLSTDFQGRLTLEKGFDLSLRNTQLDNEQSQLTLPPVTVSSDDFQIVTVTTRDLSITPWTYWLNDHPLLPAKINETIKRISPQGHLDYLSFVFNSQDWLRSKVTAKVDQVSIGNGIDVPLIKSLSGFFVGTVEAGSIMVESNRFSIHPETLYEKPLKAESARGQLAWNISPENNSLAIYSHQLEANGAFGRVTGHFLVDLPLVKSDRAPELVLALGVSDTTIEQARPFLPTKKVPSDLVAWLDSSVGTGLIKSAGFLYRGALKRDAHVLDKSIQLFMDVAKGNLRYNSDWPALSDIEGQLVLDNSEFDARIKRATSLSARLSNARIYWPGQSRKSAGSLQVTGLASSTVNQGLAFIKKSPLKNNLGKVVNGWQGKGPVSASLDLVLGFKNKPSRYQVTTRFTNNNLTLPYAGLNLSRLKGRVFYDSVRGVSSKQLSANLLGSPITGSLSQQGDTIQLDWQGKVTVDELNKQMPTPLVDYLKGVTDYKASLKAANDEFYLSFTSDLNGLSSALPAPLQKAVGVSWPSQFEAVYKSKPGAAAGVKQWTGSAVIDGRVQIGSQARAAAPEPRYYISINEPVPTSLNAQTTIVAKIDTVDVTQWTGIVKKFNNNGQQNSSPNVSPMSESLDLKIVAGSMVTDRYSFKNVQLDARYIDDNWTVEMDSQGLKGQLSKSGETPWNAAIETLYWPLHTSQKNEEEPSLTTVGQAFNHLDIPSVDVNINHFFLNNKRLGQLSFSINSQAKGLFVDNIQAVLVNDIKTIDSNSSFKWQADLNQNQFIMTLKGGSIQPLLSVWDMEDMIKNDSTTISLDVKWLGQPSDFALNKIRGRATIGLGKGQFLKTDQKSSTDLLRLLGVLNFDTWARRLRLDFSDLYKTGLAFDKVDGRFAFADGIITLSDTIDVKAPSSELSMSGSINLNNKTLDLKLKTTLPVTGNLTIVTALAAGIPAAAGVYVFGKIFKDQVDKVSTITYNIDGPWKDPVSTLPAAKPEEINPYKEFGN